MSEHHHHAYTVPLRLLRCAADFECSVAVAVPATKLACSLQLLASISLSAHARVPGRMYVCLCAFYLYVRSHIIEAIAVPPSSQCAAPRVLCARWGHYWSGAKAHACTSHKDPLRDFCTAAVLVRPFFHVGGAPLCGSTIDRRKHNNYVNVARVCSFPAWSNCA